MVKTIFISSTKNEYYMYVFVLYCLLFFNFKKNDEYQNPTKFLLLLINNYKYSKI